MDPIGLMLFCRLAHRVYYSPVRPLAWLLKAWASTLFSNDISPAACLGRRLAFAHTPGIIIGAGVIAEAGLVLGANVTIGQDASHRFPRLGNDVVIYNGACVIGGITIGDGARIGANAVVLKDVPSGAVCVGVPGRNLLRSRNE